MDLVGEVADIMLHLAREADRVQPQSRTQGAGAAAATAAGARQTAGSALRDEEARESLSALALR